MRASSSIRATWLAIRASYWFVPTILTVLAFLGALGSLWIDRATDLPAGLAAMRWFEPSAPEGARAQLTVIASAMIAIASTVFAITITAVVYASGSYGPRLLTNFMNDRGNQVSLGLFIATFVFNLIVLRAVHDPGDTPVGDSEAVAFVPQISMLVSAVSVLLAVGVLVYFLHHVPASIRINSVIAGIGRRLIHDIERRFPIEGGHEEPPPGLDGPAVTAARIGYVEIIDFAALDRIARRGGVTLSLAVRTGDFVHPHLPLLSVTPGPADAETVTKIRACFSLGAARTPTQDLEFLLDELVEIGCRALSPGVNDPFTAITAMHWMGAALAKLADRGLAAGPEQADYEVARVRPIADDFGHFVRRSFGGIRASAAANDLAAGLFLDILAGVARGASSPERRRLLVAEGERLRDQARLALGGPALAQVEARFVALVAGSRSGAPEPAAA